MVITSLKNAKVKYWVSLQNKKVRDALQVFLIEGDHLINEAQKRGLIVETISYTNKLADYYVTKEIMQKISTQKSVCANAAVVRFQEPKEIKGNVLILDGIQDPGNLGTIIRSSQAFNFATLILSSNTVDLYNDKVIRATEGMLFNTNVLRANLGEIIPELKRQGYTIWGTDVRGGQDIKNINKNKIALVMGSEGQGLDKEVKDLCDGLVYIKMMPACESLNVGVAASILMYEVYHGTN